MAAKDRHEYYNWLTATQAWDSREAVCLRVFFQSLGFHASLLWQYQQARPDGNY